jgi:hypothetical protein
MKAKLLFLIISFHPKRASCSINCHRCVPTLSFPLPDGHKPLELVNAGEVQAIVEVLLKRKALDLDGIANEMLEKLLSTGMHYLYLLVKSAMALGAYPIRWKTATVGTLLKTLNPESAN